MLALVGEMKHCLKYDRISTIFSNFLWGGRGEEIASLLVIILKDFTLTSRTLMSASWQEEIFLGFKINVDLPKCFIKLLFKDNSA